MKFYDITFFCNEESNPRFHIAEDDSKNWPITVSINDSFDNFSTPRIILHLPSREKLNYFVSSLNTAWKKLNGKEVQDA